MVDGYDELPEEFQEKIKFALEHNYIPDEDCTRVSAQLAQSDTPTDNPRNLSTTVLVSKSLEQRKPRRARKIMRLKTRRP